MATIKAGLAGDFISVATSARAGKAELYTDSGWFTAEALRQGYCEEAEGYRLGRSANVIWVEGCEDEGTLGEVFDTFESLNLARKEFTRLVKESLRRRLWAAQVVQAA